MKSKRSIKVLSSTEAHVVKNKVDWEAIATLLIGFVVFAILIAGAAQESMF